jgi:hypothetical protein
MMDHVYIIQVKLNSLVAVVVVGMSTIPAVCNVLSAILVVGLRNI